MSGPMTAPVQAGGQATPGAAGPAEAGACGRGLPVVRAVLAATLDELAAGGDAALTIEQVARRAGVNKTTVYRRWPTRAELVTAALEARCADAPPLVETGDLAADLVALAARMAAGLSSPRGRGLLRTMLAGCAEPELLDLAASIRRRGEAPARALLARAVARGELRAGLDPALLLHAISGWLVHAIFRERAEVGEADLRALVELLLEGGRPRPAGRHAPRRAARPPVARQAHRERNHGRRSP